MLGNKLYLIVFLCIPLSSLSGADDILFSTLSKHQTPVPYAGQRNWHVTQNLGATGARGWMLGERGNTTESREIIVRSVAKGSPADGVLQLYDIIIGIDKTRFTSDARLAFAKALTVAEGTKAQGELRLLVWRNGVTETVTITLPVMGDYSNTAPHDCPKTSKVVSQSAAFLAKYMPDEGFAGLTGALNSMLLLAVNDANYLDHVRRSAMNMGPNHTITDAGHETWRWGYCNLFLCEYYLATGDKRVLPTIEAYSDVLAKGQCDPGTWGHRAVPDRIPPGYGSMNQSGLICFLSMIQAYHCGVDVDQQALTNSIKFYGRYAGWGGIPYGDHPAYMSPSCNGKNGSAAVAFHLLGSDPAAQWFARSCASANQAEIENGHTGNYFNQIWTPIGASLAGGANYECFWARFNSYRDMARFWSGGFLVQSQPQYREGDLGSNMTRPGPMWSTGGFALGYLGGTKRLAILGRRASVFGSSSPKALKPALDQYHTQQFSECVKTAAALAATTDVTVKAMALQLKNMAELNIKSADQTLSAMKENLEVGDLFLVQKQLQAIESIIAKEDERLAPFYAALATPEATEIIESRGHLYGRIMDGFGASGPKGFWEHPLPPIDSEWSRKKLPGVIRDAKGFYKLQAKKALEDFGPAPKTLDLTKAVVITAKTPEVELTFTVEDKSKIRQLRAFWTLTGTMKVTLNGTVILDLSVPNGAKDTELILKPITLELLKNGSNVLKLIGDPQAKKLNGSCILKVIQDNGN